MRRPPVWVLWAVVLLAVGCGGDRAEPLLLVAGEGGIVLMAGETVTEVWSEAPVAVAVPDRSGGVVFQADGTPPVPIEWMAAAGEEPTVLVEAPEADWLLLEDVALIDGSPTLIYRLRRTLPNDCPPEDPECLWDFERQYLLSRDLRTGEETVLGVIGSFESSGVTYRFGGSVAAVELSPYGESITCTGIVENGTVLGGESTEEWIGEGALADVTWLPPGSCEEVPATPCEIGSTCAVASRAAITDDGELVAVAASRWVHAAECTCVPAGPGELVVFETATGREVRRVEIAEPGTAPTWIDVDGEIAVVGLVLDGEAITPVLVDRQGRVTTLELDGTARLWPAHPAER